MNASSNYWQRRYPRAMRGLVLSSVLLAFGAVSVLPALLGRWKNAEGPTFRLFARTMAFAVLWLCFNMSWVGPAIGASLLVWPDGTLAIPAVALLQLPALGISARLAFRDTDNLSERR